MHGNVREWCEAGYGEYPDGKKPVPVDAPRNSRVVRGGGWDDGAQYGRSASRSFCPEAGRFASVGFRVARNAEQAAVGGGL